jgi:hypothetical protein
MLALSDTVGQDVEAATPDGEWWQEVDTFSKRWLIRPHIALLGPFGPAWRLVKKGQEGMSRSRMGRKQAAQIALDECGFRRHCDLDAPDIR